MEYRARLMVVVGLSSVFGLCFCWVKSSRDKAVEELVAATREDAVLPPGASGAEPPNSAEQVAYDEEQKLWALSRKDPHEAVKAARAHVASPDAGAKTVAMARKVMPQLLLEDLRRSITDRRFEDADDTLAELADVGSGTEQLETARQLLDHASKDRIWDAVSKLDYALAESLLEKELHRRDEVRFELNRDAPRLLAERRLRKWEEAGRPLTGEALDDLETAAALVARNPYNNPVVEALQKGGGSRAPEERCRALQAAERFAAAVLCWEAQRTPPSGHDSRGGERRANQDRTQELEELKARATLRLQDKVASNEAKWVVPRDALALGDRLLSFAKNRADLALRKKEPDAPWQELQREVVTMRIRLYVADARRQLEAGAPDKALATLDLMYRSEPGWLFGLKVADGWDAWSAAPEDLKRQLESGAPLGAEDRLARLRGAVEQGKWRPDFPELMAAQNLAVKARIKWGLAQLDAGDKQRRELGEELLRAVLRESTQASDATEIVSSLQERLRAASRAESFDRLLELVSFYAAEVALSQSKDPFRDELKEVLVGAAEHYKKEPGLERLFVLTLLADVYPADAEGRKAREEALATFFEALDRARAQSSADPASMPPSGLAGLSVQAVENATSYHLLLFYDGPERFFVRVAPRRRGSVVFKDGHYRHGAVVTDPKIVPARGEPTYQSRFIESKYRIVTERGGQVTEDLSRYTVALGSYPLLRKPDGEELKVDLESGRVTRP